MGSSFFGRPNMGGSSPSSSSPTSSSSSPTTRRGKKNGSEKPKQPQRGLGVAQLEKIRLHGEISCNSFNNYNPSLYPQEDVRMQGYSSIPSSSPSQSSSPYGFYPNMMMGVHRDQYERANMSWNPSHGILESQHSFEPNITRRFLHDDPSSTRRSKSLGSGNQNSGSSENQELDLELRLSL
ncbi:PREDICTED: protein SPEAR1-like [Camelina sativa]|uniref:Protein SPEAR1-like n=1 Tax=Camelina sativa TaxID=90675 RepID=A0ABM0WA84_CAMSA|nr:PREDICTED: protein SPEAR1-like [Camelina sativa]